MAEIGGDSYNIKFALWTIKGKDASNKFDIVTGGIRHIKFWSKNGTTFKAKKGSFGQKAPTAILCGINFKIDGKYHVVTGASSGQLFVWLGKDRVKEINAHEKAIQDIKVLSDNFSQDTSPSQFATAGSDGQIKIWNESLEFITLYDMKRIFYHNLGNHSHGLKSIDFISMNSVK